MVGTPADAVFVDGQVQLVGECQGWVNDGGHEGGAHLFGVGAGSEDVEDVHQVEGYFFAEFIVVVGEALTVCDGKVRLCSPSSAGDVICNGEHVDLK